MYLSKICLIHPRTLKGSRRQFRWHSSAISSSDPNQIELQCKLYLCLKTNKIYHPLREI